ncbi:MAG: tyrosine-type recombinase/integrase [Parabacteroides sp.]
MIPTLDTIQGFLIPIPVDTAIFPILRPLRAIIYVLLTWDTQLSGWYSTVSTCRTTKTERDWYSWRSITTENESGTGQALTCSRNIGSRGAMAAGFLGSTQVNERLMALMGIATDYVNDLIRHGRQFDFQGLDRVLKAGSSESGSFVAFMQERIDNRKDVTNGTLKHHKVALSAIGEYGRLFLFDDLTPQNIRSLDDWLRSKGMKETTVYNYHKIIKAYINEAIRFGLMDENANPYRVIRVKHGRSAERVTLTVEELDRLKRAEIPDPKESRMRDLFVFQCVTGLSYADMATLDMGRSATDIGGGRMLINGRRVKTGEDYTVVLLPSAVEILDRYDWRLPIISNQKRRLPEAGHALRRHPQNAHEPELTAYLRHDSDQQRRAR